MSCPRSKDVMGLIHCLSPKATIGCFWVPIVVFTLRAFLGWRRRVAIEHTVWIPVTLICLDGVAYSLCFPYAIIVICWLDLEV
jgi:hypothetical protein